MLVFQFLQAWTIIFALVNLEVTGPTHRYLFPVNIYHDLVESVVILSIFERLHVMHLHIFIGFTDHAGIV